MPHEADAAGEPLIEGDDPFELFDRWLHEAEASEPNDPNAMALATVDADGLPDARMVLLKGHDPRGFVFYTNVESDKGRELQAQSKAALLFHWKSLRRQVRVRGPVEAASDKHPDITFAKLDTEANQQLAGSLGIMSIPTLMVFRDGILLYNEAGALPAPALEQLIQQLRDIDMDEVRAEIAKQEAAQ